jgi:hypothetical protein
MPGFTVIGCTIDDLADAGPVSMTTKIGKARNVMFAGASFFAAIIFGDTTFAANDRIALNIRPVNVPRVTAPRVNVPRVNIPRVNAPRVNVPRGRIVVPHGPVAPHGTPHVVTRRGPPHHHAQGFHGPHWGLHGHWQGGQWVANPADPPYSGDIDQDTDAVSDDNGGAAIATLYWIIANRTPEYVQVQFYAEGRQHVWPGAGQVLGVASGRKNTINMSCLAGEHICYGGWNKDNSRYWGGGQNNAKHCTNCCATCGAGGTSTTLTP